MSMKPLSALERLAAGLPLYNAPDLPFLPRQIIGTETEFGQMNKDGSDALLMDAPGFNMDNGGRLYNDGHLEWASPETRSPLAAAVWELAGERIAQQYATWLYKNVADGNGKSWGAHENYYSRLPPCQLLLLVPFLITRQLFAGAGKWNNGKLRLSQRAPYINWLTNRGTTQGENSRGIICTKENEHLMLLPGHYRIHLILGDANRSPIAMWLKLGTTALMLRLLEEGKLPRINYDEDTVVSDMKHMFRQERGWLMQSAHPHPMDAIDVQLTYHKAATQHLRGTHQQLDDLLDIWYDTLFWLKHDQSKLEHRVDWIAKRRIIRAYQKLNNLKDDAPDLESLDNTYHLVGIHDALPTFDNFNQEGYFEQLVPDSIIEHAVHHPPVNTRALGRAMMIAHQKECKKRNDKDYRRFTEGASSIIWEVVDWTRGYTVNDRGCYFTFSMDNPFNTYARHAATLRKNASAASPASQSPISEMQEKSLAEPYGFLPGVHSMAQG